MHKVCATCGTLGAPGKNPSAKVRWSVFVLLAFPYLAISFLFSSPGLSHLVPAFAYLLWCYYKSTVDACSSCGSEALIEPGSPVGKKLTGG